MKLSKFYKLAIRLGASRDPRKKIGLQYADSVILYGRHNSEIRKVLIGIDIEAAELLLADRIREREGLDLVIAHHPEGKAYASLYKVMQVQVDILKQLGVKDSVAQRLLDERMQEVERRVLPLNHTRAVDVARLLDMPFVCLHTPADNHAFSFVKALMAKKAPKTVQDAVEILKKIPEYQKSAEHGAGPRIISGSPKRAVGKILVEMTGGTEGSRDVFDKLYKVGIRTLICMHMSEEHLKKVKDANLNVVIAGHISSDNLGLNLLLDRIEKASGDPLEVVSCSGFFRVRRA